jgi:hypothetical protein
MPAAIKLGEGTVFGAFHFPSSADAVPLTFDFPVLLVF